jgi:iron-sulfur cluster biosynthesis transcriptional regulator SufR
MISHKNKSLINNMPTTRRRILTLLKEKGQLTADELAEYLGISSVAVRRHLTKLEGDQLVTYEEVQRGMGRPSFVYRLGEAASNLFPRRYEELATDMLDTIQDLYGSEAVNTIFKVRSEQLIETYRHKVNGKTLDKRLDQLTQLREADGYMSTWELDEKGRFILREANCPIIHVAEGCEVACDCDKKLLESLLDANIVRTDHQAQGAGACVYIVKTKE